MRNRGFEPWTFRSCLGYQHFVINYNNRDQRKKDPKKTSTATVAEIKTEANVAEKASALVAATDHGGKFLNTFTPVINSAWIIDSGATDHMTFDSRQVSPLRPSSQKIVDHSYPTHPLPGSLVQIVQIYLPQTYDNHNRESEFPYGTPPEVQTQMKNTSNLHETPHPL